MNYAAAPMDAPLLMQQHLCVVIEELADRIRAARGKTSRRALAERLGVDQMTIYKWEKGKQTPMADRLEAIAEATGVDPGWLLSGRAAHESTDAPDEDPPALALFLREYAPSNLTDDETAWLRTTPFRHGPPKSPAAYLELLHSIRRGDSPEFAVMNAEREDKTTEAFEAAGARKVDLEEFARKHGKKKRG